MKKRLWLLVALGLLAPTVAFAAWPSSSARTKNWGNETLTDSDLEGQFDLLHTYLNDSFNSTTGHDHDGTTGNGPEINITNLTVSSQAAGDIIYASSATAWARLAAGTSSQVLIGGSTPSWGAVPSAAITSVPTAALPTGSSLQFVSTSSGASATGSTTIPNDDTIPQNTEGTEFITRAITPGSASNILVIEVIAHFGTNSDNLFIVGALFQDSTADALAVSTIQTTSGTTQPLTMTLRYVMTAGTTSATTFKFRAGPISAATITLNGASGSRKFGGVYVSSLTVQELKG